MSEIRRNRKIAAKQILMFASAADYIKILNCCCYGGVFICNRNDSHNCCRTDFVLSRFKT